MKNASQDRLVVKSNSIIEAKYKLSVREQKFILLMASLIQPDDEQFRFYEMKISEVIATLNVGGKKWGSAYQEIYEMIENLNRRPLKIIENKKATIINWVASAQMCRDTGVISFEFSQRLKPYLLQLKSRYTKYPLSCILMFKSSYSIRLYELLKSCEYKGEAYFDLPDLREMLGIEDRYPEYRDFKRRVTNTAQKELNKVSDIAFDYKERKQGRKVMGLEFKIRRNELWAKNRLEHLPSLNPNSAASSRSKRGEKVVESLVGLGVGRVRAEELFALGFGIVQGQSEHDLKQRYGSPESYFEEKIELTRLRVREGAAENPAGYVVQGLREDYNSLPIRKRTGKHKKSERDTVQKQALAELEVEKRRLQEEHYEQVEQVCAELLKEYPNLLRKTLDSLGGPIFLKRYNSQQSPEQNYEEPTIRALVKERFVESYPERFAAIDSRHGRAMEDWRKRVQTCKA